MKIDLHCHSLYSDGLLSPAELLKLALEQQVDCFALTDHDSVFGCKEILELAQNYPVRVLAGMELSTEFLDESVHIVCLFKDNIVPQELIAFSNEKKQSRKKRAIDMMNNIKKYYGLKIDMDSLIAESEVITRANMAYHIAKLNGLTLKEAEPYVDKTSLAYIPSTKLSLEEGLAFVKGCGCITILAHPCLLPRNVVEKIVTMGVDGIEVRYPKNKEDDEDYFKDLAYKHHLLISAGSDFHGDAGTKHAMMGTSTLNEEEFAPILERLCLA